MIWHDIHLGNAKVKYIDHSIGYRIGNIIYINKNLLKYPDFATKVIKHELEHTGKFSKHDFFIDFRDSNLWDNLKFIIRHPKALRQLIPFGKAEGVWYYDLTYIIQYIILLILFILIVVALKNV